MDGAVSLPRQLRLAVGHREPGLLIDGFCGVGGATEALEEAFERPIDIAINHDDDAISVHTINHPHALHIPSPIQEVRPLEVTRGRRIDWAHFSPECTDHSVAKNGQPRSKRSRSLLWITLRWAGQGKPVCLSLENVMQILKFGPLIAKRDKATGRVIKIDKTVAAPGERVPVQQQYLIPDPKRLGKSWDRFVLELKRLGYDVLYGPLKASDFGTGTKRTRLFLVARNDGLPLNWPGPSHTDPRKQKPARGQRRLKAWTPGYASIDWSLACRSILKRKKPLADNSQARIAHGIIKHLVNNPDPFIIEEAPGSGEDGMRRYLAPMINHAYSSNTNGGRGDLREPLSVVTAGGQHHQLLCAVLVTNTSGHAATDLREPMPTITTGDQQALVQCRLSDQDKDGAERVAAFLMRYYSTGGQWGDLREPLPTITTKDRMALVTVHYRGRPYVITDITLRMLKPHELFRANGFRPSYITDRGHDGRRFTQETQVWFAGNCVCPQPLVALIKANRPDHRLLLPAAAAA